MLNLSLPLSLLALHFLGDFILQSDWMALNKSNLKKLLPLFIHCFIYSLCFMFWGPTFIVATFLTHFLTDAITSNITKALWTRNMRHWFFVAIGADQLIHYFTLAILYKFIVIG